MKKLVVYYSCGGNTRAIAKRIAKALRASIAEIHTVKSYPDDYDVLLGLGKREVESGYMPQIVPLSVDISKYDTIILGTPVWWSTYTPAVKKFMKGVNWKGKKVFPFTTYTDWIGHVGGDFKKSLRGAEIAPVFNIKYDEKTLVTSVPEIREWLKQIQ
jgi:flavodoxin